MSSIVRILQASAVMCAVARGGRCPASVAGHYAAGMSLVNKKPGKPPFLRISGLLSTAG
jgi:hypothetical protein